MSDLRSQRWMKRGSSITLALALIMGGALAAPSAAHAATAPIPDGVYVGSTWTTPGGSFVVWFVGNAADCGSKTASFTAGSTTTPLQHYGAGYSYYYGMDFGFVDESYNPLSIGQGSPVNGTVTITCTPSGGGTATTTSFPMRVGTTPPPTIYHHPESWTWFTPTVGAGAIVTVNALGFKAGEAVTVSLVNATKYDSTYSWDGAVAGPASLTADGSGAVTAQVTVPTGWASTDVLEIMAAGATNRYLLMSGEGSRLAGEPDIAVTGTENSFPGGAVSVRASGFEPGETVQFALHSAAPAVPVGTLTANASGVASGIVYIPASQATGEYRLWAGAKAIGYLILNTPLTIGPKPATTRLAGADRFDTAIAISKKTAPFATGQGTVYVASGLNFPDALSAGALAAQIGAPLVLTHPSILLDSVAAELVRLNAAEIKIVGGPPAVTDEVKAAIQALPYTHTTTRVSGPDRFATNRALVADALDTATTVYIATGLNFPDALAAAPAAASEDGAVVLVNGGASSLDSATLSLLSSLSVQKIRIVGSSVVVSTGIENQLKSLYPGKVTRYAGADRFETAAKIVGATWPEGASSVILASGVNFPDALAASALGEPMLTSAPTCIPGSALAQLGDLAPSTVTLVGGTPALSDAVRNFVHC